MRAQYDELIATGRVDAPLSDDDRAIRDLHAREVLAPKLERRAEIRASRVPSGDPGEIARKSRLLDAKAAPVTPAASAGDAHLERAVAKSTAARSQGRAAATAKPPALPALSVIKGSVPLLPVRAPNAASGPVPPAATPRAASVPSLPTRAPNAAEPRRCYLSKADDLQAAPSIGPKMAARFAALGIATVGDFLGNSPHDMAELLDDSQFDAETLTDWQDQAHLVIDIAGLRGTHAQLLVGAGYRTAEAVAEANPVELSADVLKFAATSDGRRVLRDGDAPDIEKIKSWVTFAREAMAA